MYLTERKKKSEVYASLPGLLASALVSCLPQKPASRAALSLNPSVQEQKGKREKSPRMYGHFIILSELKPLESNLKAHSQEWKKQNIKNHISFSR